jgi:hypothetical protein
MFSFIGKGCVDNTGTALIDTTTSISQDYTQRKVVDHSSLFLLFTTDDVESNDGDGLCYSLSVT